MIFLLINIATLIKKDTAVMLLIGRMVDDKEKIWATAQTYFQ